MKFLSVALMCLLGAVTGGAADQSYVGAVAQANGAAAWRYLLILRDNGNAILRTAKTSRSNSIENGTWTTTEVGTISLQFKNRDGEPRGLPLVMKSTGTHLMPVSWDESDWGAGAPPKLRRD